MSYEKAQQHFAKRIANLRERKNMTVRDFCDKCGITTTAYNYYVNRGGMPTLYTAMVIAGAFGMTVDQFLGIKGGSSDGDR